LADRGRQIRELQLAASQPFGFLVQNIITATAALGIAFFNSWNLTLVIIGSFPVVAVLLAVLSSKTQSAIDGQVKVLADASKLAASAISSIETVKLFNGQSYEVWQYSQSIRKAALRYFKVARSNALQIGVLRLVMRSMFVQGFWYGSTLVGPGGKSAGQVLTTFWACLMATEAIQNIFPQMIVLEKGRLAGKTLRLVVSRLDNESKSSPAVESHRPSRGFEGDIQFKSVSSLPAIDSIELTVIGFICVPFTEGETCYTRARSFHSRRGNKFRRWQKRLWEEYLGQSLAALV
jgi:ATP-binding cassette subfamily B (MDR/TAP) protein 1